MPITVVDASLLDAGAQDKIVLASGGWQKYDAIKGALRLLRPHVLVTDELVAERLLLVPRLQPDGLRLAARLELLNNRAYKASL